MAGSLNPAFHRETVLCLVSAMKELFASMAALVCMLGFALKFVP
jgi:hypothetical protein